MADTTAIDERVMVNCLDAAKIILDDFISDNGMKNQPTSIELIVELGIELFRSKRESG